MDVAINHRFSHADDPPFGLGSEVKFTGFPHGLEKTAASPSGFSTPLVRTAFFSGVIEDRQAKRSLLILDGLNNPGYSGGPVWAQGANVDRPTLMGLISGYRIEDRGKSKVYQEIAGDVEREVDGLFVKPNSGMIHAISYYDIKNLMDFAV